MRLFLLPFTILIPYQAPAAPEQVKPFEGLYQYLTQQTPGSYRLNLQHQASSPHFIKTQIRLGIQLLVKLSSEGLTIGATGLDFGLQIGWALYYLAYQKNQHFDVGAYMIEDENLALFNTFKARVPHFKRASSHFKKLTKAMNIEHYGVDFLGKWTTDPKQPIAWTPQNKKSALFIHLISNMTDDEIAALPTEKAHLLFFSIPKGDKTFYPSHMLYLKPETFGVATPKGLWKHMIDYGSNLFPNQIRRIKDPPHRIQSEYVSRHYLDWTKTIFLTSGCPLKENIDTIVQQTELFGIRYTWWSVMHLLDCQEELNRSKVIRQLKAYFNKNHLDHMELRNGCEVIFTKTELRDAQKYLRYIE